MAENVAAPDQQLEKFVTLFDDQLLVFDYRRVENPGRVLTNLHYPANTFFLESRINSTTTYFNLHLKGPKIQDLKVKISVEDVSESTHVPSGTNKQALDLTFGNNKLIIWNNPCGSRMAENATGLYMAYIWLKIQISVPAKRQLNNVEEGKADKSLTNGIELFNSSDFSDFEIEVDKECFKVSKFVLAFNSPVFQANISSQMQESQNNSMQITDFDSKVVRKMLEFMYDNNLKLNDNVELVEKLIMASDKYQIDKLKNRCELILLDNVSMEKAVQYIKIADLCRCEDLRQKCIDLLRVDYQNFKKTNDFDELLKHFPKLAIEIAEAQTQYGH